MDIIKKIRVWPFSNLFSLSSLPEPVEPVPYQSAKPYVADPLTFFVKVLSMLPICGIAWLCYYFDPLDQQLAEAGELGSWVWRIVIRDLLLLAILGGGWELVIFYSRYTKKLSPYKYNQKYPDAKGNLPREILLSVSTTLMGSFFEVLMLRLWASGTVTNYYLDYCE